MELPRTGFGCMRLSTAPDRDQARGVEVVVRALEAGARLLDTADAYGHDDRDRGANERLIAAALAAWTGSASEVVVATKGGIRRPRGRWLPDGRAKHIRAACEASLRALGRERIDLYQLHAPDPNTPLATTAAALARLIDDGLVGAVGLCNVNLHQLEEARRHVEVAAVQIALNPWETDAIRGGLVGACEREGIAIIVHSPLGGPRRAGRLGRRAFGRIARERGATAAQVALAWLRSLSPAVIPIPGTTRVERAPELCSAATIELTADELAVLDGEAPATRIVRVPVSARRPPEDPAPEVVVLAGIQGAGKSTAAAELVAAGYSRLNRDERGGTLAGLAIALDERLAAGDQRIVVDSTYASRAARNLVIETAWARGARARCVWLDTPLEEAQINAAIRLVRRYGALPMPEELAANRKKDPQAFLPSAQFRYLRELEPPRADEGFEVVETRKFERRPRATSDDRALILEYEGGLRRSVSGARSPGDASDVAVLDGRAEHLREYAARGYRLFGLSWQPGIAAGKRTAEQVAAAFARTHELLGADVEARYCPHAAGPPRCWCRKPLPGLGVEILELSGLDPARCIHVGVAAADRTFSRRLGFEFVAADEFFG